MILLRHQGLLQQHQLVVVRGRYLVLCQCQSDRGRRKLATLDSTFDASDTLVLTCSCFWNRFQTLNPGVRAVQEIEPFF